MINRRRNQRITIGVVIALLILGQFVFFRPVRDTARKIIGYPTRSFLVLGRKISTAGHLLVSINDLSKENNALRSENNQLMAELGTLTAVKGENDQLRTDLNFAQSRPDLKLTPAAITDYSLLGGYQSFTIDKGASDGVKEGQAVVSSGYLIGRVNKVSGSTAQVFQLSNRNLITPVTLVDTQTTGLLKGSISGLIVDNVPVDAKVAAGELITTSSLEGLYPAGIAVGKVAEIISQKEAIFLSVRVSNPINVASLTTVYVVSPINK
ncbi:MAG TPA: rod shape-determining protein MreC [Candidatus Saccharimonadales bacterium]|nr:rod shape-determining protein MreC [Candidatus Saccharimonadales bacterium]